MPFTQVFLLLCPCLSLRQGRPWTVAFNDELSRKTAALQPDFPGDRRPARSSSIPAMSERSRVRCTDLLDQYYQTKGYVTLNSGCPVNCEEPSGPTALVQILLIFRWFWPKQAKFLLKHACNRTFNDRGSSAFIFACRNSQFRLHARFWRNVGLYTISQLLLRFPIQRCDTFIISDGNTEGYHWAARPCTKNGAEWIRSAMENWKEFPTFTFNYVW